MSLCRRFYKHGAAAILRYHSIVEPQKNYYASPSISISPSDFEYQIRYLSRKYNIVSLDMVSDCIQFKKPFPDRSVVLTFDDGYRDNYQAYQILKRYNVPGTFYVVAGCIGSGEPLWLFEVIYLINKTRNLSLELIVKGNKVFLPLGSVINKRNCVRKIIEIIKSNNLELREELRQQLRNQIQDVADLSKKAKEVMLSWKQLKEMSNNGMNIGGHTMTHLNLPNADEHNAEFEIKKCKDYIQENIGVQVKHFSYPNGGKYEYYNSFIVQSVVNAGYETASTSNNGLVFQNSNLYELQRIRVTNTISEILYQISCEPIANSILKD